MCKPVTSSDGASQPLTRGASTGQDNEVQTVPFSVLSLSAGDKHGKWDPSKRALRVEYRISDENSTARSGRIVYFLKRKPKGDPAGPPEETILHTQALAASEIKPAKDHINTKWDGKISEGLNDRIGKKVTADLSPVGVRVELWNQATAAPGKAAGEGKTDVPGEYLSTKETRVTVDVVGEAKWARDHCIPFVVDPRYAEAKDYKFLEPELGQTGMKIRVNVAEGTEVRIAVCRIVDIGDPSKDELYTRTPTAKELKELGADKTQDGLSGAVVDKSGRVILADGSEPSVQWKHYDKHWPKPGENNFYCFKLAFGKEGQYQVASERDYGKDEPDNKKRQQKESACLHMRFTVLIHCPQRPRDGFAREVKPEAQHLHNLFRKGTRYYRSYLTLTSPPSLEAFCRWMEHRYIVIFFGHSGVICSHPDHPRNDEGELLGVPLMWFDPDQNACPSKFDKKKVRIKKYGACPKPGNKEELSMFSLVGQVKEGLEYLVMPPKSYRKDAFPRLRRFKAKVMFELPVEDWTQVVPRLLFYTHSCRTTLATNLAEGIIGAGTRYFAGHTWYSLCINNLCERFFRRWIVGDGKDKPQTEFDLGRLVDAFVAAAKPTKNACDHPRITDSTYSLTPRGPRALTDAPLSSKEEAME